MRAWRFPGRSEACLDHICVQKDNYLRGRGENGTRAEKTKLFQAATIFYLFLFSIVSILLGTREWSLNEISSIFILQFSAPSTPSCIYIFFKKLFFLALNSLLAFKISFHFHHTAIQMAANPDWSCYSVPSCLWEAQKVQT